MDAAVFLIAKEYICDKYKKFMDPADGGCSGCPLERDFLKDCDPNQLALMASIDPAYISRLNYMVKLVDDWVKSHLDDEQLSAMLNQISDSVSTD